MFLLFFCHENNEYRLFLRLNIVKLLYSLFLLYKFVAEIRIELLCARTF